MTWDQDEALSLLEKNAMANEEDVGWENVGDTTLDNNDMDDDSMGISAYAEAETAAPEKVNPARYSMGLSCYTHCTEQHIPQHCHNEILDP